MYLNFCVHIVDVSELTVGCLTLFNGSVVVFAVPC